MNANYDLSEYLKLAETVAAESGEGPATDLQNILDEENISISYNDYGPYFDGFLEYENGNFHVYCNLHYSKHSDSGRARFTVAHELGHYFIDYQRLALMRGLLAPHKSLNDFRSDNLLERQADAFAASLLLPEFRLRECQRRTDFGISGIRALSASFKTSMSSTAIRYVQISQRPCAVIRWNDGRVAWMEASPEMRAGGATWTSVSNDTLPKESATRLALENAAGYQASRGTVARAWFNRRGALWRNNTIMVEEAYSFGPYGALTFLHLDT